MTGKNIGIFALSLFMLATAPIFVKFSTLHPLALLVWRLLLVSFLLLPFVAVKIKFRPTLKELRSISFVSILLVAHFYTWFKGVPMLPIAVATIIYATNPIYTALLGRIILREPYYPRYALSLVVCLLGILATLRPKLLALWNSDASGGGLSGEGVIYMLITSFFYSCYMTFSKKRRLDQAERRGNSEYNFFLNLFACIFTFAIILILNSFNPATSSSHVVYWNFSPANWWPIFGLALFPSLMGHVLMVYSVAHINLNFASLFKLINPLLSSLLAYLIFGEVMTMDHWIGFALVSLGVFISL